MCSGPTSFVGCRSILNLRFAKLANFVEDVGWFLADRKIGLDEGASTRMLIYAGRMIAHGIPIEAACQVSLVLPITDDQDIRNALAAAVAACV